MSSTLENTVNEILKQAVEKAAEGAEWVAGQIPEVVEQLLLWHLTEALVFAGLGLLGFALLGSWWKWAVPVLANKEREWDHSYTASGTYITSIFLTILNILFGVPAIVINSLIALKILIAPKLYLLEYAAKLVN